MKVLRKSVTVKARYWMFFSEGREPAATGGFPKMQLEEFLLSGKNSFFQLTDIIAKGGR